MIKSKSLQLSRCNYNFLLTLAEKTNLSNHYYKSKNKPSLLQILSNKFDSKTVDLIVKMYLLCHGAEEVAKRVSSKGMVDIVEIIPDFFGLGSYLYEVTLGKRVCDVVLIKGQEVIAIEVKSANDKISRAVNQTKYYSLWANRTYLVYDTKHSQRLINELRNGKLLFRQRNTKALKE